MSQVSREMYKKKRKEKELNKEISKPFGNHLISGSVRRFDGKIIIAIKTFFFQEHYSFATRSLFSDTKGENEEGDYQAGGRRRRGFAKVKKEAKVCASK